MLSIANYLINRVANSGRYLVFSLVFASQFVLAAAPLGAAVLPSNLTAAKSALRQGSVTETSKIPRRSLDAREADEIDQIDKINESEETKEESQKLREEAADKAGDLCPNQLRQAIDRVVNQSGRSQWGILVTNQNTNQVLYDLNPDRLMTPASNVKLLTSAAALSKLGGQFRTRTSVYERFIGSQSNQLNELVIVGRGDPSLDNAQLQNLGQQLLKQGRLNANTLVGDDSYFQGELFNPLWAWADVQSTDAPAIGSLIINQGYVTLSLVPQRLWEPLRLSWSDELAANQWRIANKSQTSRSGSSVEVDFSPNSNILEISGNLGVNADPEEVYLPVLEPSLQVVQNFQAELKKLGINVNQTQAPRSRSTLVTPYAWQEVAAVESPPLATLLVEMNRESNNFYAEMLSHQLGKVVTGDDRNWVTAVGDSLTSLGVDAKGYKLVDGSGLARQNQVTPRAIVQTLQGMANSPEAIAYRNSLSQAGENGTLRSRLRNIPGNFWGKTGTLRGVVALSGYLDIPDYDSVVVSIIVNNPQQSTTALRQGADGIVSQISRLKTCSN
jgi:serine-type D-Ala-D-Ala carboxypeptidase/endopeptidase (penicillin-binding protein 4)